MATSRTLAAIASVFMSLALASPTLAEPAASPGTVALASGRVRGTVEAGVESFKGIPYAAPPVGALRWRPPQPAAPWQGERAADRFGPECMQTDDVPKSEDCLTLNVWRPADAAGSLPVMVWIYGGALVHGQTSLYPAAALAKQGVIVVSMNYRMGRLGFFAHPALKPGRRDEAWANYGYLDQRAALVWVRRNIAAFGGNPKAVTIFGESAGGGSVLVHLTSPLSRGLFQRAILQSPGIPTPRPDVVGLRSLAGAQALAVDYARSMGVTAADAKARAALRALSTETLTEGTEAKAEVAALSSGKPLAGVAGSIIDGAMVLGTPASRIARGRWAKVPVMVGANDRDLPIGVAASKEDLFGMFGPDADEARRLYDPDGSVSLEELKQQVFADRTMTEPARHLADLVARAGQPAWLYRFSYVAEALRADPAWKGTPHGLEIPYTFDLPAALVRDKVTAGDREMAQTASAYWVAFARTGDPNGAGRPAWPRHEPGRDRILNFTNAGVVVGPDPIRQRLDLWEKMWNR